MLDQGVVSKATPSAVDLSWDAYAPSARYEISRDGKVVATLASGVSTYRDTKVSGGSKYRYNIVPLLAGEVSHPSAKMWSMSVGVPSPPAKQQSTAHSLQRQGLAHARAAAPGASTSLWWDTFIPQSRIDAPPVGCEYGSGYAFGGDGRTYSPLPQTFRTRVGVLITWYNKDVRGDWAIGETKVYRKSDGAVVSRKTASGSGMVARKLSSGSDYVGVRLETHASNPFCSVGAIDGGLTMHLKQVGHYSVISGNHRQMPNHHVYIQDYNDDGLVITDVYKRDAANPLCLIGTVTCPLANFFGSGSW
ncbi:DUF3238 domain-containing protein [Micromonospora sp. HNM0581]|uniref:DUF3238 domain-containing protein n=1 Tax=Micromonospora sp. HNM0581 TaxID=2716341 RepID=UPI00146EE425|nr:DUF3238 domain-containing protein [Micromonospora sp. HNM0581]NLU81152.1 DUF3238 domain-containing protein [Micromonospora sp. HNM0581]